MPCFTTPEEIEYYEEQANLEVYGFLQTDDKIIATIACALAKSIRKHNLFDEQESYVKTWILRHEKLDKQLAKSNMTEQKKEKYQE